ncbi:RluA family pseudouridine synthase [Kurthia sibirica]|uniref:RluA family pseudouridine synthase n=1 Tax=Kurthia sibirica TaxID=202750 RepID=UPI0011666F70|nr:RluA family pseudouridine synthase [Kurthia sibirica]GEK34296.1 pseudouridine synthase [Kurthia sibirica]
MDNRYSLQFPIEEPQLLRTALTIYGISKKGLTAIKHRGGELLVNGVEKTVRHSLERGDVVTVIFPPEIPSDKINPSPIPLNIVYEDEELLIVNKPPFLATIPSYLHQEDSVASRVVAYFSQQNIASTVHIVNRLDRDTSGLMCIAKHSYIHYLLCEQQKQQLVHRTYEALVEGHIAKDYDDIIAPICRKDGSMIERIVSKDGQFAHTNYTVVERFAVDNQQMTRVRLTLFTGRTHQIRVHMMHIGHPLVGDVLYGASEQHLNRQALHGVSLKLTHPITQQHMAWDSELPTEIQSIVDAKN